VTSSSHRGAVALALLVTLLWSSSWVLIRFGLEDEGLTPLSFAGMRYALAAMIVGGWVLVNPRLRLAVGTLGPGDWMRLMVLGLVFYAITQGAQFVAIGAQPAATTSLILAFTPLLVGVASSIAIAEAPHRRQLIGGAVIVGGALLYFVGDLGFTGVGLVAAFIALLANTASSLIGRQINRVLATPAFVVTALSMGMGALLLLAAGVAAEGWPRLTARGWLIVVWLAAVNTALAFTWWNQSLRVLTATESAAINNTMLIQIGLLAWWLLDEVPGPPELIGMVLVSVGVLMAQRALTIRQQG
jgi:drug/metabolite transporter (DMT)-like permease